MMTDLSIRRIQLVSSLRKVLVVDSAPSHDIYTELNGISGLRLRYRIYSSYFVHLGTSFS
jgi:hypothetical protein